MGFWVYPVSVILYVPSHPRQVFRQSGKNVLLRHPPKFLIMLHPESDLMFEHAVRKTKQKLLINYLTKTAHDMMA